MSLETLPLGQEFTVKAFKDYSNPVVKKLYAMGLKEGTRSKLLLKNGRVFLIRVNNSRLIIDKDLAKLIEVS